MTVKSWSVGDVLTASDMNVWTVPVAAVKPSTTGRASTTTMTNDPDITLAVAANAIYEVVGLFLIDGASMAVSTDPGGFKWTFTVPAGVTGSYFYGHNNLSAGFAGAFPAQWTDTASGNTTGSSTANTQNVAIIGVLNTAGTAGSLTLQWAQNTSSGTNTHVQANSYLRLQRIG
jgi:hypothetical protein